MYKNKSYQKMYIHKGRKNRSPVFQIVVFRKRTLTKGHICKIHNHERVVYFFIHPKNNLYNRFNDTFFYTEVKFIMVCFFEEFHSA